MLHLEGEGLTLGSSVLYEAIRVPYGREGRRTYVVDFALPERKQMIEVKPEHRVLNRNNWAKRKAAQEWAEKNGWEYLVVTEREISAVQRIPTLEEAAQIVGVELNPRATRALRRKMNRKGRKRR